MVTGRGLRTPGIPSPYFTGPRAGRWRGKMSREMSLDDASPIVNPRRAPRLVVRCQVRAEAGGAPFGSETEDLGLLGCQLVAPTPLDRDTALRLHLSHPSLPEALSLEGRVAWTGPHAPWRHGVAFVAAHQEAAARWIGRLTSRHPELLAGPRTPAQIDPAARLHLGEPPRYLLDFTAAELAVLRQVQAGVTAGQLRRRLAAAWEPATRALFSLLARRAVTLEPTAPAGADGWAEPLGAGRPAAVGRLRLRPAGL